MSRLIEGQAFDFVQECCEIIIILFISFRSVVSRLVEDQAFDFVQECCGIIVILLILFRSVVSRLVEGQAFIAETFSSVTIYFR